MEGKLNFHVYREPLYRKSGADTGYDALYRADGSQISVVSREYALVTHQDAVNQLQEVLDTAKMPSKVWRLNLTNNNKRLYYEVLLEQNLINIKRDQYVISLTLENSLNRTRSLIFQLGVFRVVCSNGAKIRLVDQYLSIPHIGYKVESAVLKLREMIESFIPQFKGFIELLHSRAGFGYVEIFFKSLQFPPMFKVSVFEKLKEEGFVTFKLKKTSNIEVVDNYSVEKQFSLYEFWNAMTFASTRMMSDLKRPKIDRQIAQLVSESERKSS